jgi:hypothetical protein
VNRVATDTWRALEQALTELNDRDRYILAHDLSERCIVSRLAFYLQHLFPEQCVDVEYNRAGASPKKLDLPEDCANYVDADGRSLVVPDVIVHRRGDEGPNLLVLEVKKTTNWRGTRCDEKRIPAFIQQLRYDYGALIKCETRPYATPLASVLARWSRI